MFYSLENDYIYIQVLSLGATLNRFIDKSTEKDIVLGFDKEEDYLNNKGLFFGATVGRTCNRTKNAEFELNGIKYHLLKNDGENNLHSGDGISFSEFNLLGKTNNTLSFQIIMEDGKDGFPGRLILTVNYILNNNRLLIEFEGLSDKDTIFNITNHSYFNLSGGENSVLDHLIKVYTNKVAINDENNIASDVTRIVNDTAFDFTDFKTLADNIEKDDDNLSGGGIDHNYVFESLEKKRLVSIKNNEILLNILSDLPGLQIYSSNYIDNVMGKNHKLYNKFWGLALEPQFYPNSINYNNFIKPIIKANSKVKHFIEYEIERLP